METKEYAMAGLTEGKCVTFGDGSIGHYKTWADDYQVICIADRLKCERLSDGSIAHVPSQT